jgi:RNA polymerase sigma-70 factor, ECF subfamily
VGWRVPDVEPLEPTRREVVWLEPCPDLLLEALPDHAPGPEARVESGEAISLAFVTALQLLPARQRSVLILRDVLGFRASEVAGMLDTTVGSVTSALKRARATVGSRMGAGDREPSPLPNSPAEADLAALLTRAYETGNVEGLVALLTEDVWVTMPPLPLQYQGRELAAQFPPRSPSAGEAPVTWFRPGPTGSSPSAPTCATRAAGRSPPWACWCSP